MSPPGHDERRPTREPAPETTATKSEVTVARYFDVEIPTVLARRRASSWRMPILPCGYRDPFDERARNWPRDADASRAAWHHLNDLGLMSELVERVLAEMAGAA